MHGQILIKNQRDRQALADRKLKAKRKLYQESREGAKVQTKDYENGTRGYITKTLLMQGAIPKYSFRAFTSKRWYYDMIKQMSNEGLLRESVRNGYRFIVFDDFERGRTATKGTYPPAYVNYFYNYINTETGDIRKIYSSKKEDSRRMYEITFMRPFMYNAGVGTLLEDRDLPHKISQLPLVTPTYYTSIEFKRMITRAESKEDIDLTKDQKKAKSILRSRISGLLFSQGGMYLTYDIQDHLIEWYSGLERRMAVKGEDFVKEKAPDEYKNEKMDVIVYAKDLSIIERVVNNDRKKIMQKFIYIDYAFPHFYMLPLTIEGVWHTHEMTNPKWQVESFKRIGLEYEDVKRAETSGVVCDAYKSDLFILNMTIPDFGKIKQFANASHVRKSKGQFKVYCYSYQEPLAKSLMGDSCDIEIVPQPKYEREVKKNAR